MDSEPKTPIVLAHGLMGALIGLGEMRLGPVKAGYFRKIDRAIAGRGHPVITPLVHPTGGIATRAAQLKGHILRHLDDLEHRGRLPVDGRCILIGHSMGGLDCRYLLSHLGLADRVRALVTIATPHHGSPMADWALRNIDRKLAISAQLARLGLDLMATRDLTCSACSRFNDETPDMPGVSYFSISAGRPAGEVSPLLRWSAQVIEDAEGLNDGLVSVASARWATHLETWPADHFHTINLALPLPQRWRGGDIAPRYLSILDRLAEEGVLPAETEVAEAGR